MAEDSKDGNSRSLKPELAERIRQHAASSGGGSGSGARDSGSSGGSGSGSDTGNSASGDSSASESGARDSLTLDESRSGLKIIDKSNNGSDSGARDTGSAGDRSENGRRGIDSGGSGQLLSEDVFLGNPSTIRVSDVITNDSGLRIVGGGTRKPRKGTTGTRNKTKNKGADYSDIILPLKIALDFVFGIPVQLGWGKHWELNADEADELSTNIKDVLEAFPSDTTAAFVIALEKYIPLLTLAINLYQLMASRFEMTRQFLAEQKRLAENESPKEASPPVFVN